MRLSNENAPSKTCEKCKKAAFPLPLLKQHSRQCAENMELFLCLNACLVSKFILMSKRCIHVKHKAAAPAAV